MGCAWMRVSNGSAFHLIARVSGDTIKPCNQCGQIAFHFCDWPMGDGKTCDAPLCVEHAIVQGPRPQMQLKLVADDDDREMIHFCPVHALLAELRG